MEWSVKSATDSIREDSHSQTTSASARRKKTVADDIRPTVPLNVRFRKRMESVVVWRSNNSTQLKQIAKSVEQGPRWPQYHHAQQCTALFERYCIAAREWRRADDDDDTAEEVLCNCIVAIPIGQPKQYAHRFAHSHADERWV